LRSFFTAAVKSACAESAGGKNRQRRQKANDQKVLLHIADPRRLRDELDFCGERGTWRLDDFHMQRLFYERRGDIELHVGGIEF
jgi:hypothetical protein